MSNFPPTIIVVHPRERRSKCSVEPLRTHTDFRFWKYPTQGDESPEGYVRLGFGGPLLSPDDASRGLFVLDATWRLAEKMEQQYPDLPVRSLPVWRTAYPRVSKMFDNPEAGLATIEAIFAAYHALGRDTTGLLDNYHFAEEFLGLNANHLVKH